MVGLFPVRYLTKELGGNSRITLFLGDHFMFRNVPSCVNDFFCQFGIGGIGDVFSPDRGINDHFFLLDLWIKEIDRQL